MMDRWLGWYLGMNPRVYNGGGGASGEVGFPDYIETVHKEWLYDQATSSITLTIEDAMDTAFGADPYVSYSYDTSPINQFVTSQSRISEYLSNITALLETTDYATIIDQAVSKADECDIDDEIDIRTILNRQLTRASRSVEEAVDIAEAVISNDVIQSIVDAFDSRQSIIRAGRVRQYNAGMADLSATQTSSYMMGLALIHAQEVQETAQIHTQITSQLFERGLQLWMESYLATTRADVTVQTVNKDSRTKMVLTGVQVMDQMKRNALSLRGDVARLQTEHNRVEGLVKWEYDQLELDLDVKSALWDLTIHGKGMALLAGLSGYAHPFPEGPSKAASALGGALGGAATGAAIGSAVPGIGTAIGAGVGALIGGIGGLLG